MNITGLWDQLVSLLVLPRLGSLLQDGTGGLVLDSLDFCRCNASAVHQGTIKSLEGLEARQRDPVTCCWSLAPVYPDLCKDLQR